MPNFVLRIYKICLGLSLSIFPFSGLDKYCLRTAPLLWRTRIIHVLFYSTLAFVLLNFLATIWNVGLDKAVEIDPNSVYEKESELNAINIYLTFINVLCVGIWVLRLSFAPPTELKKNQRLKNFSLYVLCIGAILAPSHIFEYRSTQRVSVASKSVDPPAAIQLKSYIDKISAIERLGDTEEWCDLKQALSEIGTTKTRGVDTSELVDFAWEGFELDSKQSLESFKLIEFRTAKCYKSNPKLKTEDDNNPGKTRIIFSSEKKFRYIENSPNLTPDSVSSEDILNDLKKRLEVAKVKENGNAQHLGTLIFLLINAIFAISVAFTIAATFRLKQLGRIPSLSGINRVLLILIRPLTDFPGIRSIESRHLIEKPMIWSYRFASFLLGCSILCSTAILADKLEYAEIIAEIHTSIVYLTLFFLGSILLLAHLSYQLSTPPPLRKAKTHKRWITLGLSILACLTSIGFLSMTFGDNYLLSDLILICYIYLIFYFFISHALLTFKLSGTLQIFLILGIWLGTGDLYAIMPMIVVIVIPILTLLFNRFHRSQLVSLGAFFSIWILLLIPLTMVESIVDNFIHTDYFPVTSIDTDYFIYFATSCLWMFLCLNTLCRPFLTILAKWKTSPRPA